MPEKNSPAWDHIANQSASVRDDIHRQVVQKGWYQDSSASSSTSSPSIASVDPEESSDGIETAEVEAQPIDELYGETREGQAESADLYGESAESDEVTASDLYGEAAESDEFSASDLYGEGPAVDIDGPEEEPGIEP